MFQYNYPAKFQRPAPGNIRMLNCYVALFYPEEQISVWQGAFSAVTVLKDVPMCDGLFILHTIQLA
jgi:hypothetical protein